MKPIIAIDPGMSGAIAWRESDGTCYAENMPDTFTDISDFLRTLAVNLKGVSAIVEKVGTYVPGNSGPASVKFARHCGHIESALYCLGIPSIQITPQKWMKKLGALPKDKKERKNAIKAMMAARFPHINVTLKNADALGLLATEIDHGR